MHKYADYETFLQELETETGYQVYDERTASSGVKTPYIVCQRINSENFLADNTRWLKRDNIQVNLHTFQRVHTSGGEKKKAEIKVESYLENQGYIFDTDTDWLENEELFVTTYGVQIWYE